MNELYPYQVKGAKWLASKRFALLADEMGLGKSAQAIAACDLIGAARVCILCPAVVRTNWLREFEKFGKMPRAFISLFQKSHPPILGRSIVCSYDLANSFNPIVFGKFDVLILDEGHYLKSVKAKRAQKVLGKEGYVRYAKKVWTLTGTPAPNHAGELWPILYTFGLVSESYERFLEKFCTYIDGPYGRQITGTKQQNIPELKRILAPFMLRRKADEVLDLPELFFQTLTIDPEPNQIDFNFQTDPRFLKEKEILEEAFGHCDLTSDQAMMVLEGLAGSVSTLKRYLGLKKVGPVGELVSQELKDGAYNKIVLFATHTHVIETLKEKLLAFNPQVIYGATTHQARDKAIHEFQNNKSCRVFIGNIQAAGTGITLTAANQALFVEQDWVPGNNAQAAKRLHRIGQSRPVFVRVASLANSFDEQISYVLMRKARELAEIFGDERKGLQNFPDLNKVFSSNENS